MQTIVFDVETGPLAESELSALLPPFDPAEVKTGNLKEPAKIAEKLAEAEARFKGVPAESDAPPKPLGNNPSRTQGGASGAQTQEETLDQMRKRVFSMPLPSN